MTKRNSAALTALAAILIAAPAYAGSHMEKDSASKMTPTDVFMKIDVDSDSQLTFTEFADFSEQHGVNTSDAAQEFSRLAGQETTIDMDGFANFDMAAYKHHKMDSAMQASDHKMSAPNSMETYENQPTAVLNRTVTTTSTIDTTHAGYGTFSNFDANADGKVSFKEYSKLRKSQGVTSTTQAAQEFTRLSGGQAVLTAAQYDTARMNDVLNQPSYRADHRSEAEFKSPNRVVTETTLQTKTNQIVEPNLNPSTPAGLKHMDKALSGTKMKAAPDVKLDSNSDVKTDMKITPETE
eukprot:GHVR01081041.1.p1 GENE.GHVR01081041.1~~GHVR01081041.1.p1  ORF type:complete len:295 (-),score=34.14 GHVR01081041.1:75-959(-)